MSPFTYVAFAQDININDIEKAGNELDNLTDQLKNLDLNNLPAEEPAKDSTDNTVDIKTNMMIAARNTYTLGLQNNAQPALSDLKRTERLWDAAPTGTDSWISPLGKILLPSPVGEIIVLG